MAKRRSRAGGRFLRRGLSVCCALTLAAGLTAAIAPAANAATQDYEIVFQANTGSLWYDGNSGAAPANLGMAPGTSPTITAVNDDAVTTAENCYFVTVSTGGDEVWNVNWVASNYVLSQAGADNETMAPGTSASNDDFDYDYLILTMFQGFNGDLWTSYGASTVDTGLAMKAGTSPSVTALEDGTPEVAYQGSNGDLWVATQNADNGDWTGVDQGLGMMADTSPAITAYYPCSICRNQ